MRCEVGESFNEKRESGFEVNAIGGEDHVVIVWDVRWERVTPGMTNSMTEAWGGERKRNKRRVAPIEFGHGHG